MARRLSDEQRQELSAFGQELYRLGGFPSQAAAADAIGAHWTNVSEWLNGKAGMDGWTLYRLITEAARQRDEDAAATAVAAARSVDRLAALEELVRESVQLTREALERLELAAAPPAGAAPRARRPARTEQA